MIQSYGRCPHGLNAQACLKCFHAKQAAAPKSQPKPRPEIPRAHVATGPGAEIIEEVKRRAVAPASKPGPVHMGRMPDGSPVAPTSPPTGNPRPVFQQAAVTAQGGGGGGAALKPPFSYTDNVGKFDQDGLWHPPKHRELIDRLPRHPEAGKK